VAPRWGSGLIARSEPMAYADGLLRTAPAGAEETAVLPQEITLQVAGGRTGTLARELRLCECQPTWRGDETGGRGGRPHLRQLTQGFASTLHPGLRNCAPLGLEKAGVRAVRRGA
jgi:hypothetical protein